MKKILIISSNRLGDCILSSGLINYCKNQFDNCKITFICGKIPYDLFRYHSQLNTVLSLKKKKFSIHWFLLWYKVFFNIWELVIDLRGSLIGFFLITKNVKIYRKSKYEIQHKVVSTSKLVSNKIYNPCLDLTKSKKKYSFSKNIRYLKKFKLIGISASTNWIGKQWPSEYFTELIERLKKEKKFRDYTFIFLGSKQEKSDAELICKNFRNKEVINFVGKLNLFEIFYVLKECNLFIGNDSGLMHFSAALNVPTIGLFGPSDIRQYRPWGKKTITIRTPETPEELMSNKKFSYKQKKSLMLSLKASTVFEEIIKFVNQKNIV
ncbi:MAG: hypothetical protein CMP25_00200 [Rickettsiales bacterium]|nr:hypothetical protein [Rickettsiales bacterium]